MAEHIEKEVILRWIKEKEVLVHQNPRSEYSEGVRDSLNSVYADITKFIESIPTIEIKS